MLPMYIRTLIQSLQESEGRYTLQRRRPQCSLFVCDAYRIPGEDIASCFPPHSVIAQICPCFPGDECPDVSFGEPEIGVVLQALMGSLPKFVDSVGRVSNYETV